MTESKHTLDNTYVNRVLVFKEAPEVIYTGLSKQVGKARELEKNEGDQQYFNTNVDIRIPVEETQEY